MAVCVFDLYEYLPAPSKDKRAYYKEKNINRHFSYKGKKNKIPGNSYSPFQIKLISKTALKYSSC